MSNKESDLFTNHEASALAYGNCPQCDLPLQIKFVGKSSFLGCSGYPQCDYSQSLHLNDVVILKTIANSHCPQCDEALAVKKGRYGMFIGCTNFPHCHYISTKQSSHNKSEYNPVHCPSCNKGQLNMKQNRFGKFFYACSNYPKCKYLLNSRPVEQECPQCGFAIMLEKAKQDKTLQCPNSECGFQMAQSDSIS